MLCTLFSNLRYGGHAKVVHFLGKTKPWSYKFDPRSQQITGSVHDADTHSTFLVDWWILYSSAVVPMMQQQYGDQPFHSGCEEVNGGKNGTFLVCHLSFWSYVIIIDGCVLSFCVCHKVPE